MFLIIWFLICHIILCVCIGFFNKDYSINMNVPFEFPNLLSALYDFLDEGKQLRSWDVSEYTEFHNYLEEYHRARSKFDDTDLLEGKISSVYLFIVFLWLYPFRVSVWMNAVISTPIKIIVTVLCLATIFAIPILIRKLTRFNYTDSSWISSPNIEPLNPNEYSEFNNYIRAEKERCESIIVARNGALKTASSIVKNNSYFGYGLLGCFCLYCLPFIGAFL